MASKEVKKAEERKSLVKYFRGVRAELKKVIWPTKKQVLNYSTIVIIVSILFSLLFLVYDKIIVILLHYIYQW